LLVVEPGQETFVKKVLNPPGLDEIVPDRRVVMSTGASRDQNLFGGIATRTQNGRIL
jgi:hypothetical protein